MNIHFQVFDSKLPSEFTCRRPGGGYFMWVSGPPDFDSDAFSKWCLKEREVQVRTKNCPVKQHW